MTVLIRGTKKGTVSPEQWLREREFREKKVPFPLYLLLSMLCCVLREELCGRRRRVSSLQFFFNYVAGCFEQLNLNMQAQSVRLCGC